MLICNRLILFIILLIGLAPAHVYSLDLDRLKEAQKSYEKGDFHASSQKYLQLAQQDPSHAGLFYNLGHSLYREGENGPALAAFLRAFELRPSDPNIRYNVKFLLNKNQDKLDLPITGPRWLDSLMLIKDWGERTLFFLTVALLFFSFAVAAISIYLRRLHVAGTFGLLLALGCAAYTGAQAAYNYSIARDWGAVSSEEVSLYSGPTEKNAVVIFKLHRGSPFALLERSGDWLKIQLSDEKTGWLKTDQVTVFGAENFIYRSLSKG